MKAFREFVIGLTSFIKHQEITGLFTSTTPTLMGGASITEGHISTLTDSIVLLRYVEMFGEMKRGITVLKMRGSAHDKGIREFNIDQNGMHLGKRFRNVTGILAGTPTHVSPAELEAVWADHEEKLDSRKHAESGAPDRGDRRSGKERRRST
jgi:circadian clock protein KaiC